MKKYSFPLLVALLSLACNNKTQQLQTKESISEEIKSQQNQVREIVPLSKIDLSTMTHITPSGRVQDRENEPIKVVEELIADGKDSIPFLINKLEDETKVKEQYVIDFWGDVRVDDVALIILSDFFHLRNEEKTIEGVDWYEFLECKNPKETPANNCLYDYIKKHGRKGIKAKWQRIWEYNKDKIYWEETERCFRLNSNSNQL